jgi:hypothetical protein
LIHIPKLASYDFDNFLNFVEKRREFIVEKIQEYRGRVPYQPQLQFAE